MNENIVEIPLTQGKFAIVDAEDYPTVSGKRWFPIGSHTSYAVANIITDDGKHTTVRMHRLIMDAKPGQSVDHINGNGLDNRRCNLRFASQHQNNANQRKHKNNTSGFKGVSLDKKLNKWRAMITINRRAVYIGSFNSRRAAAIAYDIQAIKHFGEYAKTNGRMGLFRLR
jgi:hypothetical protein